MGRRLTRYMRWCLLVLTWSVYMPIKWSLKLGIKTGMYKYVVVHDTEEVQICFYCRVSHCGNVWCTRLDENRFWVLKPRLLGIQTGNGICSSLRPLGKYSEQLKFVLVQQGHLRRPSRPLHEAVPKSSHGSPLHAGAKTNVGFRSCVVKATQIFIQKYTNIIHLI